MCVRACVYVCRTSLSDPKYSKELKSCLSVVMERITTHSLPSSLQALAQ